MSSLIVAWLNWIETNQIHWLKPQAGTWKLQHYNLQYLQLRMQSMCDWYIDWIWLCQARRVRRWVSKRERWACQLCPLPAWRAPTQIRSGKYAAWPWADDRTQQSFKPMTITDMRPVGEKLTKWVTAFPGFTMHCTQTCLASRTTPFCLLRIPGCLPLACRLRWAARYIGSNSQQTGFSRP